MHVRREFPFATTAPGHRRLAYCLAISTLTVAVVLAVLDWPAVRDDAEPMPAALELLLTPEKVRRDHQPLNGWAALPHDVGRRVSPVRELPFGPLIS